MQRVRVNLAQDSAIATHTLRLAIDPGKGRPDETPQGQRHNGRAGPDGVACSGMRVARRCVKEDVNGRRHVEEVSLCIIAHSVLSSWHGELYLANHCSRLSIPTAKLACTSARHAHTSHILHGQKSRMKEDSRGPEPRIHACCHGRGDDALTRDTVALGRVS